MICAFIFKEDFLQTLIVVFVWELNISAFLEGLVHYSFLAVAKYTQQTDRFSHFTVCCSVTTNLFTVMYNHGHHPSHKTRSTPVG